METIKEYLNYYSTLQSIEVVYRPHPRVSWGRNRKMYDGNCDLEYNHRSILDCEVVFDFDSEKQEENVENSFEVVQRLSNDNIYCTVWDTGNKGMHIHTLWSNIKEFKDLTLMKKTILKYYAYGMNIDYQLASKHLVRMEYGINDKKWHNNKMPLSDTEIVYNTIPEHIIEQYKIELNRFLTRKLDTPIELDDNLLKEFLEGKFEIVDGREKFMVFLINALKNKMQEEELVSRICSWYFYSSGTKLTERDIRAKVRYHITRNVNYSFGMHYFKSLMKDYDVKRKE